MDSELLAKLQEGKLVDWSAKRTRYLLWKRVISWRIMVWWLTNKVYLVDLEWWENVVIKMGADLSREVKFWWFVTNNEDSLFPKLLEGKPWDNRLVLEYREWKNGKEVVDFMSEDDCERMWEQFWKVLRRLHSKPLHLSSEERNTWKEMMIAYLAVQAQLFSQAGYDKELDILREMLSLSKKDFVVLHWDYSPHNCLFEKDKQGGYYISTILDPSGRVDYGVDYFDVVYLFNTRWNRNKEQLKKWFLSEYHIDTLDPLFVQAERVMRMYLAEVYFCMGDIDSVENIMSILRKK